MDRGELYRITPPDIDWKRNEVRIRGTKTEARDRVMPMPPEVASILRARNRQWPMFENWHNALRDLAKACQKAGVPRCNFKDLRRSFATDLAKAGVSPLFLKDLMGHTTTRMLEKVYARVQQGDHMHEAMTHVSALRNCAECVPNTASQAAGAEPVTGSLSKDSGPNSTKKPKSGG
jgi:integrase